MDIEKNKEETMAIDTEKNVDVVENVQIVEDKTKEELEKVAAEYADKDPAMAEDLRKLAKSRLSIKSFNEYMRLRTQGTQSAMLANEKRHYEKLLAKRRKASKNAKKMRKLNRKK